MRTIERTARFKRDYKRESKGRYRTDLDAALWPVIASIANDSPLPERLRDHALIGEWQDHRDCHIKPDLVLIYSLPDPDTLILVRLGSHSELSLWQAGLLARYLQARVRELDARPAPRH